jgi:hypothetical protein
VPSAAEAGAAWAIFSAIDAARGEAQVRPGNNGRAASGHIGHRERRLTGSKSVIVRITSVVAEPVPRRARNPRLAGRQVFLPVMVAALAIEQARLVADTRSTATVPSRLRVRGDDLAADEQPVRIGAEVSDVVVIGRVGFVRSRRLNLDRVQPVAAEKATSRLVSPM